MAEKEYRRLTWRAARPKGRWTVGFTTRDSLWLGKDHLLSINSTWFTEEYKRFYFRDIQAIVIRKTRRREFWTMILSLLLLPCAGLAIQQFSKTGLSADLLPWGIMTGIVALPLVLNNLLGPACTCYVRTAVQVEQLASMNRVRRAHRILERIRPLIAAAQGELTPEEISSGMRQLTEADAAVEIAKRVVTSELNFS